MDSIDELLAKLKADAQNRQPKQPDSKRAQPAEKGIDSLLQEIEQNPSIASPLPNEARLTQNATPQEPQPNSSDSLLEQVRSQYEQQDQQAAERQAEAEQQAQRARAQQAKEKQQRLEQLRTQRRAELTEQAATWLKNLNPKSNEGRWFEEFACNYSSRLEAAIDYLEALSEVDLEP